ncbi:Putative sterol carrier protein [Thermoplasmatales archaeon]|nr:Putative sterol carrier protein [Thermoplasmatales archaeon]
MSSKDILSVIVDGVNANPNVSKEIASWDKIIQFKLSDSPSYYVHVSQGKFSLAEGEKTPAAATISAADSVLTEIFTGATDPVKAFLQGKVKISGDIFGAQKLTGIISKARK